MTVSPRFLGYVSQQYNTKTNAGIKRAVKAYDRIIQRMPNIFNSFEAKNIRRHRNNEIITI